MYQGDQIIADKILENSLRLERFSASERKKVLAMIEQLQKDLKAKLNNDLTDFGKARVNKLLKESTEIIEAAYKGVVPITKAEQLWSIGYYDKTLRPGESGYEQKAFFTVKGKTEADARREAGPAVKKYGGGNAFSVEQINPKSTDLLALAEHEAAATARTFAAVGLTAKLPTDAVLRALSSDTLLFGAPLKDWWAKQADDLAFRYSNAIRQGIVQGETLQQMIVRVFGSKKLGTPGIGFPDSVLRRNASALVHDSIMKVSGEARMEVYKANDDIIKGYYWLSTLDGIICIKCVARSGATWNLEYEPIGKTSLPFEQTPLHVNCRCVILPLMRSFRELGLDIDDMPKGTRASDLGQVPADLSFDGFLKRHSKSYQDDLLGPGRADLWRRKVISLTDLVSQNGRPLTIEQLKAA